MRAARRAAVSRRPATKAKTRFKALNWSKKLEFNEACRPDMPEGPLKDACSRQLELYPEACAKGSKVGGFAGVICERKTTDWEVLGVKEEKKLMDLEKEKLIHYQEKCEK